MRNVEVALRGAMEDAQAWGDLKVKAHGNKRLTSITGRCERIALDQIAELCAIYHEERIKARMAREQKTNPINWSVLK